MKHPIQLDRHAFIPVTVRTKPTQGMGRTAEAFEVAVPARKDGCWDYYAARFEA